MLDEVVASAQMRCVEPVLMDPPEPPSCVAALVVVAELVVLLTAVDLLAMLVTSH